MKNKLFIIILLLSSYLYSLESADQEISKKMMKVFGEDISLEQIEKVLEFDNTNREALIKKAIYMDNDKVSLSISKDILKNIDMEEVESKLHYISILYRLKEYEELISFSEKINLNVLNSADTLYFLSDSYIHQSDFITAKDIIKIATHQFPYDQRFLELLYQITLDRKILTLISNLNKPLQSYIRLYNRIDTKLSKLTLEVLIENEIKKLDISSFINFIGNYEVIKILLNSIDTNKLNGLYKLDIDSDSYPDTLLKVENGIIEYKGFDRDRDNVIDYEIFLENSIPKSVVIDGNILSYGKYPYIDYISMSGNERITYNLFKNYTKYKLPDLIEPVDFNLIVDNVPKMKLINKSYYLDDKLLKKIIFKDFDSYLLYSEPNKNKDFDKCLFVKNDIIISGLRDLNSDGIFDLCEVYQEGKLIGSAFSATGKTEDITFIETYDGSKEEILNKVDFQWLEK